MVGEAEFFLLRRVKSLYEELDRKRTRLFSWGSWTRALAKQLRRYCVQQSEFETRSTRVFKLVGVEVMNYYDDIRQTMEKAVEIVLCSMIDQALWSGSAGFHRVQPISKSAQVNSGHICWND